MSRRRTRPAPHEAAGRRGVVRLDSARDLERYINVAYTRLLTCLWDCRILTIAEFLRKIAIVAIYALASLVH